MKHLIIGTAGHVDHGKTSLVRALTGVDTDRLAEEKKRGVTIELGFASLELPDGNRAGVIDVPGHERFIRHMLAGAGGVDLAMLAVAADEGVMPQTVEHLGVLGLLGVERGVIVITKADLADGDWLDMVREDVAALARGTFLEGAPCVAVSARTGEGIESLRALLSGMLLEAPDKEAARAARLPIDRVFTMEGFGTVVTGTLIEGAIRQKQELALYPSGRRVRVRSLQVHSAPVETAWEGQRVAVNLQGVEKAGIARGDTLAAPDSMLPTRMADVKLTLLGGARPVAQGSRLHFYHGARETVCRVVLMDVRELEAGQSGYARLNFEEDMAFKPSDRFVARFYSPVETVGGGVVLDACPVRHRPRSEEALRSFRLKETGGAAERTEEALRERARQFYPLSRVPMHVDVGAREVLQAAQALEKEGRAVRLSSEVVLHMDEALRLWEKLRRMLEAFHRENPLISGMKREDIPRRLLPAAFASFGQPLLAFYVRDGRLREADGTLALAGFEIRPDTASRELSRALEALYLEAGFAPPATDDALAAVKAKNAAQALSALVAGGALVRLTPQICIHRDFVNRAWEAVLELYAEAGAVVLGEYRTRLGTSRKFAVALLEYFDRQKRTKKTGDARTVEKAYL